MTRGRVSDTSPWASCGTLRDGLPNRPARAPIFHQGFFMALNINFPDKVLTGVHLSCTIFSDEGPPTAVITVGDTALDTRVIPLGPPKDAAESTTPEMKYKVTCLVPEETAGTTLKVVVQSGDSRVEEEKEIVDA